MLAVSRSPRRRRRLRLGIGWCSVSRNRSGFQLPFTDRDAPGEDLARPDDGEVDRRLGLDEERLTVRTRQAGIFGLGDSTVLWASAYGLDVWIVGPLSLGLEVDLVIGDDAQSGGTAPDAFVNAGAGLGMMLDFDPITLSLAGRGSFGDSAMLSDAAVSLAVRGTYDLGQL